MRLFYLIVAFQLSSVSNAGDLIYKSGLEATALVSGVVTGLTSSGMVVQLGAGDFDEELNIDSNEVFVFFTDLPVGTDWSVSIAQLPNTPQQQNCSLSNGSGVMPAEGAGTLTITCNQDTWNWDELNWGEGGWN